MPVKTGRERITTRTRTTRYVTLLSVVLALALTVALAACGSDEPSGVTGPDRTASTPTETPVSPAQTPTPTGSGDAPTATDAPGPAAATAPPAASGFAKTEREALVALYNATDGENWDVSDNWLSDAPLVEWHGFTIEDDGRVMRLNLNPNPPKDTDGRREDSGRGWVRELQGRWPGAWGRWEGRRTVFSRRTGPLRPYAGVAMRGMARGYAAGDSRDRGGARLRGR